MEFVVFQRTDRALIVVPAVFQPPLACQKQGPIQKLGRCELELEHFSPAVAAALAEHGFAEVEGDDWQALRRVLADARASEADRVGSPA